MKHHSTESASLKAHNDIIISMDKVEVTALILLHLSAVFDTIDHVGHATLTDRLSDWYGISGQAQIWFSSYLKNRYQSAKNKHILSHKVTFSYGVWQGLSWSFIIARHNFFSFESKLRREFFLNNCPWLIYVRTKIHLHQPNKIL